MEEEKLIIDVETEEERRMDQFLADQNIEKIRLFHLILCGWIEIEYKN